MSFKIRLTTDQSYELADRMKSIDHPKLSRRLLAISLRHYGYPVKQIALLTGVSEKTVTEWFKLFLRGGFDDLLGLNYPKDRGSKLAPHRAAIRSYWVKHPCARLEDLQQWLLDTHGVEVEYSWLFRYLKRHGLLPKSDGDPEA